MKGLFLLVSVLINCDKGAPSCKDSIEKASKLAGLDGVDVTMAIGTCEQQQWSLEARQCVSSATSDDALAACGSKLGIDVPTAFFAAALAKLTAFRDEMCKCQDPACVQRVSDEMTAWSQTQMKLRPIPPKMNEDQTKRATELGEQMGRCMQKAMAAGSGKMPF